MESIIEQLYAPPEVEDAYNRGVQYGLKAHKCPKVEIHTKTVYRARKEHPRSQRRGWGVINNGKLLNPTFHSQAEATQFILEGLVPANPEKRLTTKIDAMVIKL